MFVKKYTGVIVFISKKKLNKLQIYYEIYRLKSSCISPTALEIQKTVLPACGMVGFELAVENQPDIPLPCVIMQY